MQIKYVNEIEGSPVVQFVARAWCALMKAGQWDSNSVLVSPELQCVYATEARRIIGCLTFHVDESEAVVNIAYVTPDSRGRGAYRAMHDRFLLEAKKQGATEALNICYPSNTGIQKTCEKLGYRPYVIHLKREIK
ncbi:MAG TPA: GNAT family N-acetyltransferase [Terracidiphilus sp.]|nr:GNAT family N-acetyltransferase [Terracidiphilus sp.]